MGDFTKLVVALPLVVLFLAGAAAPFCIFDCSLKAARHLLVRDEDLPWMLRWNKLNAIYYPSLLDSAGRSERRKAIIWMVFFFMTIILGAGYVVFARHS
jgi:cytochrome b subunit of formate dehydrogenase